jgi:hypothetical protein
MEKGNAYSVGVRQADIVSAVTISVLKIKIMKIAHISQENVITGPRRMKRERMCFPTSAKPLAVYFLLFFRGMILTILWQFNAHSETLNGEDQPSLSPDPFILVDISQKAFIPSPFQFSFRADLIKREKRILTNSWTVLSPKPHSSGVIIPAPRGPKAMPTSVASGGSERCNLFLINDEKRA